MRIDINISIHNYGPPLDMGALREKVAMISKEVQDVLDRAKQSTSLVQSVHLGMQGLQQQVSDMKAKIDSLPVGNVLGDDDKAALQEAANNLDTTINTLKSDIPANTSSGATGNDPSAKSADAPQPDQSSGAQGSDGGAKPLPGTGQS